MAITYKLDETYTGKRTTSMPDPDNEGKTIDTESDVTDIIVTFTSDSPALTHTRNVNVVLDSDGKYDSTATITRIEEVAAGVAHKVAVGVISNTAE
jgi:hypothetical protein